MIQPTDTTMAVSCDDIFPRRSHWGVALMRVERNRVMELATQLAQPFSVQHMQLPSSGLGMLRLHDSAANEAFNLGEVPISSAHVELSTQSGEPFRGGAALMTDDEELAVAVAIIDAVAARHCQAGGGGGGVESEEAFRLIARGLSQLNAEEKQRGEILRRSRVDFSLLNQGGEVDDDTDD